MDPPEPIENSTNKRIYNLMSSLFFFVKGTNVVLPNPNPKDESDPKNQRSFCRC